MKHLLLLISLVCFILLLCRTENKSYSDNTNFTNFILIILSAPYILAFILAYLIIGFVVFLIDKKYIK
jgi:hypothetical protein